MDRQQILQQLEGGLIVSCQALEDEPLHSSYIMSRMAYSAMLGGAAGIRANSVRDITEMRYLVDLPIIGIVKRDFDDSPVRITPTMEEVDALVRCGVEIIATDATDRLRTGGITLDDFFGEVRKKYPDQLFMADCSTFEEAVHAQSIGFDFVGTTLRGYTEKTKGAVIPDFALLRELTSALRIPIIAEGGIWSPADLRRAMDCGVHACVVGTAITRPRDITRRYADALK